MLSKNKIKYLSSLSEKKARMESMTFLVEGEKMVFELIESGFKVETILYAERMEETMQTHQFSNSIEIIKISDEEAKKISSQKTPQGIFAVAAISSDFYSKTVSFFGDLTIVLHDIQDPGNFGTIIRMADWFGIKNIWCSKNTVDILNPKVLQSTMGAVFRVNVIYTDLMDSLKSLKKDHTDIPILAAVLQVENLYKHAFPANGILMMGNESRGLSTDLIKLATHKVTIPRFGDPEQTTESLNVSVATAIIIAELKRTTLISVC